MFGQIASFLADVVASFFVYLLLARFLFQWLRVPLRNVLGEFIIAGTNWMVLPARRVVPALLGLDLASFVLAWLVQGLGLWAIYAIAGRHFGSAPEIAAALLAGLALIDLVRYALVFLIIGLLVQALLSWFSPYSPMNSVMDAVTRPLLRPVRRFVPPLGRVDLSPLVLIVLLQIVLIPLAHLRTQLGGML